MADTRRKSKKHKEERLAAYEGETLDARITRVSEEKRQQRREDVKSDVIDVPTEIVEQMMLAVPPDEIDKFAVNKKILNVIASQSFIKQYFRKWEIIRRDFLGDYWINIDYWDTSPFYFIYLFFKLGVHRKLIIAPAWASWGDPSWDGAVYHLSEAIKGIVHLYKHNDETFANLAVKYIVNSNYIEPTIPLQLAMRRYASISHYLLYRAVTAYSPRFYTEMIRILGKGESEWIKQHTLYLLRNINAVNVLDTDPDSNYEDFNEYFVSDPDNYYNFVDYLADNDYLSPWYDTDRTVGAIVGGSEIEYVYRNYADESDEITEQLLNSHHYLAMARLHVGDNTLTDEQRNLLVWHPEFDEMDEMDERVVPDHLANAYRAYQRRIDAINDDDLDVESPGTEWYARHPQL